MDERLRFVARLLEGEKMAPLCAEFGISRKTGYKIFDRYKTTGTEAFSDRSRRPYRQANRLPMPVEATIVRLKREYPHWGAPKIREKLSQQMVVPQPRNVKGGKGGSKVARSTSFWGGSVQGVPRSPRVLELLHESLEFGIAS
jgi:hypothetical protein